VNFYQFHIGDYAAHTRNLSLIEDLAYRRLLDAYYLAERPFNGCSADVAREIGMRDHLAEVEYVLNKFFELEDGAWVNKRASLEIAKYKEKQSKASSAGRASAERRLNGRSTDVEKSPTSVDESSTDVQLTKNQEPRTNTTTDVVVKTQRKRSVHQAQPMATVDDLLQAGFGLETASEFIAYKSNIKAPLTLRAWRDHLSESKKAGWSPLEAAEKVMAKSWKGFEAKYVINERPIQTIRQPKTYRERDAEAGMRRWEEMTGQRHPDRDRIEGQFIDVDSASMKLLEASQ